MKNLIFFIMGVAIILRSIFPWAFRSQRRRYKRHSWHRRTKALFNFIQRNVRRFKRGYDPRMEDWYRKIEDERHA